MALGSEVMPNIALQRTCRSVTPLNAALSCAENDQESLETQVAPKGPSRKEPLIFEGRPITPGSTEARDRVLT